MKKRILLFSIATVIALGLIITAIAQIVSSDDQVKNPSEAESSTDPAESVADIQNLDEAECLHVISTEYLYDGGMHFKVCTVEGCDHVQDKEKCYGGKPDCQHRARCTVCGGEYGELGSHSWSEEWTSVDAESHVHACTTLGCSATSEAEHHAFTAAADGEEKYCSLCGYQASPEIHTHTLTEVAEVLPSCISEGNSLYYICTSCNDIFADPEGLEEIADILDTVTPAIGHISDGKWQTNDNAHWSLCVLCGVELEKSEHLSGTEPQADDARHWFTCVCGKELSLGEHFDDNNDGECDVCGYLLSVVELSPEDKESQAISAEGEVMEEILRPAQITILRPVASGTLTKSSSGAVIDYSNSADGYVMVQYTQNISERLKVKVEGPTTTYTYNLSPQEWTVFPLSDGNGAYKIIVYKNVTGNRYAMILAASINVKLNNEFAPFLRPNQYVNYENATNSTAKAAELVGGIDDTLKKVEAIYSYVVHNISYDYAKAATVQSGYLPDLDMVLKERKGICFDYAALMTGMLRSQNIACKLVVGYADGAYHAWISVWTPERGWVDNAIFFDGTKWQTMDPTFASTGGSNAMQGVTYTSKYIY